MRRWYYFCVLCSLAILLGCLTSTQLQGMPSAQPQALPAQALEKSEEIIAETEEEVAEDENEEMPGAETVELPASDIGDQGNWVKKNEWLSKGYELRNEIQNEIAKVQAARQSFNTKYNAIDDSLDNFYKKLGLKQGKLDELFNNVTRYLNKKKKKLVEKVTQQQKDGTIKERDLGIQIELIEDKIKKFRTQLDQLKLDMKSVEDLDNSINQRLQKADEQIKLAIDETAKVNDLIEKQWNVIDHNIARKNYYELKGTILERLKGITNYLTNDLLNDFDRVSQSIKAQFSKIEGGTRKLESEGIIIKDRSTRIEQIKLENIRKIEEEKQRLFEEAQKKKRKRKRKKKLTWYQKMYDSTTSVVARIFAPLKSLYNWIFGAKKVVTRKRKAVPAPKPATPIAPPPSVPVPPAPRAIIPQPAPALPVGPPSFSPGPALPIPRFTPPAPGSFPPAGRPPSIPRPALPTRPRFTPPPAGPPAAFSGGMPPAA